MKKSFEQQCSADFDSRRPTSVTRPKSENNDLFNTFADCVLNRVGIVTFGHSQGFCHVETVFKVAGTGLGARYPNVTETALFDR